MGIASKAVKVCHHCHRSISYIASTIQANSDLSRGFSLKENFVTQAEEQSIIEEINPRLLRRKYNKGHWDGAIVLYREMEKKEWTERNAAVMKRFEQHVFGGEENSLSETHILDLSPEGLIKPHIDSIKFCGALVSGLSLMSDAVMRLTLDEENYVDVYIPERSLYIMSNAIRYKYTHEILPSPTTVGDRTVERTRRITVMKRSKENSHSCEV